MSEATSVCPFSVILLKFRAEDTGGDYSNLQYVLPYCQAEAPNVNRLYDKIEGNASLKGKIS